jgi:hypothetical protein
MGSFFSIFKSKKKPKHRISSKINSIENPSAARERRHERRGSVQEPMVYHKGSDIRSDDEPQTTLYAVYPSQTRRHRKISSRSAPSRSIPSRSVQRRWYGGNHTRKQNRAYK